MGPVDKQDVPAGRMRRIAASAFIVVAAVAAMLAIGLFRLSNLLNPSDDRATGATIAVALSAIPILAALALSRTWAPRGLHWRTLPIFVALIAGATLMPLYVNAVLETVYSMQRQAEQSRAEGVFVSRLSAHRDDIDARIRDKRSYAPAEALALVEFVQGSDLGWRSLPDHWNEALPLLVRALDGAILDPNALVQGPRPVDVRPEPLFVFFYRFHIAPLRPAQVRPRDRVILSLLLDHGADLSAEAAAPLATGITAARTPPAP